MKNNISYEMLATARHCGSIWALARKTAATTFASMILFFSMPSLAEDQKQAQQNLEQQTFSLTPKNALKPIFVQNSKPTPPSLGALPNTTISKNRPKGGYEFGPGDKLKIVFYSRKELSGEHTVDGQGHINLPIIGLIDVQHKTSYDVQDELSKKYLALSGSETYLTVEILERRPFFILGEVKSPGAYPFTPGLSVLQALAISGGILRETSNNNQAFKYNKEKRALRQAVNELQRALARRTRLQAELNPKISKARAPARLKRIAGLNNATTLMNSENEIMKLNKQVFRQERKTIQKTIQLSIKEQKILGQQLSKLEKLYALQKKRMRHIRKLAAKRVINASMRIDAIRSTEATGTAIRRTISDIYKLRKDIEGNRSKFNLMAVKRNLNKKKAIILEIEKIRESENIIAEIRTLVGQISDTDLMNLDKPNTPTPTYELVRGDHSFEVQHNGKLRPGDVLRVILGPTNANPQPLIQKSPNNSLSN